MSRTKFQIEQFDLFDFSPKKISTDGMSLPGDAKMGPNCGLTAMAIAAGCNLSEARAAYAKHHKMGGNWKGGTQRVFRAKALTDLGVKTKEIDLPRRTSLKNFSLMHTAAGKRYIVTTTGHVQVVRGDEVIDQHGKENISDYWGKRKIVKEILEIIE